MPRGALEAAGAAFSDQDGVVCVKLAKRRKRRKGRRRTWSGLSSTAALARADRLSLCTFDMALMPMIPLSGYILLGSVHMGMMGSMGVFQSGMSNLR
jgi:hypothetical protein